MKKSNKNKIEEFIRVDHAGERGAIKIYEGQLLALNTFIKNDKLSKSIFYLLCAKYLLRPSVTVFYYREAFLSNIFPTTRITFDKKICSSQNFFPIEYFINKNYIIKQKEVLIEVKYHKFLPELIRKIFIRNNLYKITFSKYAKCLENS